MRLPPPRFTVRRLMVAVTGMTMGIWIWGCCFADDPYLAMPLVYGATLVFVTAAIIFSFICLGLLTGPGDPPPK